MVSPIGALLPLDPPFPSVILRHNGTTFSNEIRLFHRSSQSRDELIGVTNFLPEGRRQPPPARPRFRPRETP